MIIDGMLKQDTSTVNDLSAFSYKGRVKGCKDVSVIYAYDLEAMEPICAEVFPGNSIDAVSYRSFIVDNDIRQGIIIADKGFPPVRIIKELGDRPDLHFLTPIKRNDARITNNAMLTFSGVLEGVGDHVLYKKQAIKGGRYLYSFKSSSKAAMEEADYLKRREQNHDFISEKYEKKRLVFGVIVFESDLDMDPKTAYLCYDERWILELVFKQYKNDQCLDQTNVQGDFSLMGSEFINFISTVLTCRLIQKARDAGLLNKMSYKDLMDDLSSAWRMVDAPAPPHSDDSYWVHTIVSVFEELETLGYPYQFQSQHQRSVAGQRRNLQSPNLIVQEAGQGRIAPRLPLLYSTADWESITQLKIGFKDFFLASSGIPLTGRKEANLFSGGFWKPPVLDFSSPSRAPKNLSTAALSTKRKRPSGEGSLPAGRPGDSSSRPNIHHNPQDDILNLSQAKSPPLAALHTILRLLPYYFIFLPASRFGLPRSIMLPYLPCPDASALHQNWRSAVSPSRDPAPSSPHNACAQPWASSPGTSRSR